MIPTICKTCNQLKKEYKGQWYCGLTCRDVAEYLDEPDCVNYEPKNEH